MTSKRQERVAAALAGMVDRSDQVTGQYIASELVELGQRAWALRARVVDMRDVEATFMVSIAMLDLMRTYGLDIGAGPGGTFERGDRGHADKLFGIDIYSEAGDGTAESERHRSVTLMLTDDGSAVSAPIDMSKIRGAES